MADTVEILKRQDVPEKYTWNAESVFADADAWQAAYKALAADYPAVKRFEGHLGENPTTLYEFFEESTHLMRRLQTIYFYALMQQSCDTADEQSNAMVGQAGALYGQVIAALAFSDPEILEIGLDTLTAWMQDRPRLAAYTHYLDNLFRKQAHVRSAEVEELLGMLAEPFGQVENTAEMLTNAEIAFESALGVGGLEVPVTQGNIEEIKWHPDREVRRTGWQNYADGYLAVKGTLSSNYSASIKQAVFNARARRYDSTLDDSLFENNIPPEVFRNLIDTYQKNIPTWHRYWAVKRKALGVDTMYPWDIWAPISQSPELEFEQSVEWICEGLAPLGEDYVNVVRKGCLEDRWVDVMPNKGKRQGAFSYGSYDTYPFIMMSWNAGLKSLSTLAHELGHSMHSYETIQHQIWADSHYSLFVAEVASNFNQALVRAFLLKANPDPKFQIAVIEEAMDNFHRYFFIMPILARFELEMHERTERGEGLTAETMNQRMLELFQEGYGVELDPDGDRTGITWATFGHLYAHFYVYQYATGISAAHALAEGILEGKPGAVANYRKFLSLGGSVYPLDALKIAGVDMTGPAAVESTFAVLARYIDKLEALVG
ncbi:MAG: oligoendopeptidase F [Anaerolineae bacterium]|nr:oligoendopeptidase F [Anaerolineae bacterium]